MKTHIHAFCLHLMLLVGISSGAFAQTLYSEGFENWDTTGYTRPFGWTTVDNGLSSIGIAPTVIPSEDAHTGDRALAMRSVQYNEFEIVPLLNIDVPVSGAPASFHGWYKGTFAGDSLTVLMVFSRYDEVAGERRGVGTGSVFLKESKAAYTAFAAPILMIGQPDTVTIIISGAKGAGSYFLDDLRISSEPLGLADPASQFVVFPNPASEILNIPDPTVSAVLLHDISGRLVLNSTLTGSRQIQTADLKAGLYLLTLCGKKGEPLSRERICVRH